MIQIRRIADVLNDLRSLVRFMEEYALVGLPVDARNEATDILLRLHGEISDASNRLHMVAGNTTDPSECQPGSSVPSGRREGCNE